MLVKASVSCAMLLLMVGRSTGVPQKGLEPPAVKPHYDLADSEALFEKFIKDYNRNYKDEVEKRIHYEEFVKTLKTVNELNSDPKQGSAWFDINDFADYTDEQRKHLFGLAMEQ